MTDRWQPTTFDDFYEKLMSKDKFYICGHVEGRDAYDIAFRFAPYQAQRIGEHRWRMVNSAGAPLGSPVITYMLNWETVKPPEGPVSGPVFVMCPQRWDALQKAWSAYGERKKTSTPFSYDGDTYYFTANNGNPTAGDARRRRIYADHLENFYCCVERIDAN